jgi:hypothetical protein
LTQLKIDTSQDKSKSLDTKKMATFLKGVESGLKIIRKDFDDIKQCFMDAVLPGLPSTTWKDRVATTDSSNDTTDKPQTISTTSTIVSVGDTPLVAKETVLKKDQEQIKTEAEQAKTTLEEKIGRQSDEFRRAQEGDTAAQDRLREEIAAARNATSDVYSKYEALSKNSR